MRLFFDLLRLAEATHLPEEIKISDRDVHQEVDHQYDCLKMSHVVQRLLLRMKKDSVARAAASNIRAYVKGMRDFMEHTTDLASSSPCVEHDKRL